MASDAKLNVKISADVSEFQAGIIRSFVATLDDEGRAALLDALMEAEGWKRDERKESVPDLSRRYARG